MAFVKNESGYAPVSEAEKSISQFNLPTGKFEVSALQTGQSDSGNKRAMSQVQLKDGDKVHKAWLLHGYTKGMVKAGEAFEVSADGKEERFKAAVWTISEENGATSIIVE